MNLSSLLRRRTSLMIAGVVALAAASGQVLAVATYQSEAVATLTLLSATPADEGAATPLDLEIEFDGIDGIFEEASNGFALGDASTTNTIIGSFFEPSFVFDVAATAEGEAEGTLTDFGASFTDAFASFGIDIINNGITDYEIFVAIDFALDATASVDSTVLEGSEAYAEVVVGGFGAGDLLVATTVDTALIASAGFGGATSEMVSSGASVLTSFVVGAGDFETLFVEAYATGFADASPIPLPPALPLMAGAILCSVIFGRRMHR